jgi:hypothetical protein
VPVDTRKPSRSDPDISLPRGHAAGFLTAWRQRRPITEPQRRRLTLLAMRVATLMIQLDKTHTLLSLLQGLSAGRDLIRAFDDYRADSPRHGGAAVVQILHPGLRDGGVPPGEQSGRARGVRLPARPLLLNLGLPPARDPGRAGRAARSDSRTQEHPGDARQAEQCR